MNVLHKVTLQSLKKNRTRTIVTIIGIILSAAMICAVTTFTSSLFYQALENAVYNEGSWHGKEMDVTQETCRKLAQSEKVQTTAPVQLVGYSQLSECNNADKPYLYVLGDGGNGQELLQIHITEGRYPQSPDEILLPEHLQTSGGIYHAVGDTITLALGDRMLDGDVLNQFTPYLNGSDGEQEEFVVREERSYRIVGIYSRFSYTVENFSAPGYTAITLADPNPGPDTRYDLYFTMKNPKEIYDFQTEMNLEGITNESVLQLQGSFRNDHFSSMLVGLACIVIGLIVFGSVALIYNAFSISVSERTKQFGLLSSIGATQRQLAGMVRFEALAVSAIGIPLGIFSGIGGIGVTLMLLKDQMESFGSEVPMRLHVSFPSILASIVLSLATVLISAWIPSHRARKVSAVEAIRQTADVRIQPKELKTSRLTYHLFGLSGVLASKYYKRSKKKYRTTIFSLFMSVVLFVSATSFGEYLMAGMNDGYYSTKFDLSFIGREEEFNGNDPGLLLEKIRNADQVTGAAGIRDIRVDLNLPMKALTDRARAQLEREGWKDGEPVSANLCFLDDESYLELLKINGLEEEAFLHGAVPKALAVDELMHYDPMEQRYEKLQFLRDGEMQVTANVGRYIKGYYRRDIRYDENGHGTAYYYSVDGSEKILEIPESEIYRQIDVHIGAVIHSLPYYVPVGNVLSLYYPISAVEKVIPEYEPYGEYYEYRMVSSNHRVSYQAVKDILDESEVPSGNLTDLAEMDESSRNIVTVVQVFSYGFIVLISLIAIANVFNTISTNVMLRRREFAMLRSVGMQHKDFNKMMNFECLLYGTKALLYGLPVAGLVTYQIWRTVSQGFMTEFRLPLTAMGIAVLSVFLVVFATMMYAMRKIKKDDLMEALKNENI